MKLLSVTSILIAFCIAGCSGESELVGIWKASSVDISFAKGKIPPEKMEEAAQMMLREKAPAFDLNSDGSARVFGGGIKCSGSWSSEKNIVNVNCPKNYIKLERNGNTLTTLPDKTFTFKRQ